MQYGGSVGGWVGTRYSPPTDHRPPIPRVHLPTRHAALATAAPRHVSVECGVGLKSVGQLSLSVRFSRSRGITEGYNLVYIGRISNHYVIPGNK